MIQIYGREEYLAHYGVKGMRWGIRKDNSSNSGGLYTYIAKRQNKKIDKSFQRWKDSDAAKKEAIEKGKIANQSRLAYEKDKSNKELETKYKQDYKDYKHALNQNTTYRKGSVKKEVLSDLSRKHLSEAKKVKKQLDSDPTNQQLQKKYKQLSNAHEVERMQARRAENVAANRSRKIASFKRAMTITAEAAALSAAVAIGVTFVNKYTNVDISSKDVYRYMNLGADSIKAFNNLIKYI